MALQNRNEWKQGITHNPTGSQPRSSPVSHLLPLHEHPAGLLTNGEVQPAPEVVHNPLLLQQQRNPVDRRDIMNADDLCIKYQQG